MIDVEAQVFQMCADAFRAAYPRGYIAPEYVAQPPRFPAVMVEVSSNTVERRAMDNGSVENAANIMVEMNVYSNLNTGKKAQAKAIASLLDDVLAGHKFTRDFMNPIPNFNDATIYRVTARYERLITDTERL